MSRLKVLLALFGLLFSIALQAANPTEPLQWVARYNTNNTTAEFGSAVAVDSNGYVYVAGAVAVGSSTDFLTMKFSPNGDLLWTTNYNGPANGNDAAWGIALDNAGNVYVVGTRPGLAST